MVVALLTVARLMVVAEDPLPMTVMSEDEAEVLVLERDEVVDDATLLLEVASELVLLVLTTAAELESVVVAEVDAGELEGVVLVVVAAAAVVEEAILDESDVVGAVLVVDGAVVESAVDVADEDTATTLELAPVLRFACLFATMASGGGLSAETRPTRKKTAATMRASIAVCLISTAGLCWWKP